MRLVLDTNVLITAFVSRGVCHELLEHCQREHRLVSSPGLLAEFHRTLLGKLKAPEGKARMATDLLRDRSEIVRPVPLPEPVCRDEDDDQVLATALAGDCRCIVTGDEDLLVLEEYGALKILSPSDFWQFEASAG